LVFSTFSLVSFPFLVQFAVTSFLVFPSSSLHRAYHCTPLWSPSDFTVPSPQPFGRVFTFFNPLPICFRITPASSLFSFLLLFLLFSRSSSVIQEAKLTFFPPLSLNFQFVLPLFFPFGPQYPLVGFERSFRLFLFFLSFPPTATTFPDEFYLPGFPCRKYFLTNPYNVYSFGFLLGGCRVDSPSFFSFHAPNEPYYLLLARSRGSVFAGNSEDPIFTIWDIEPKKQPYLPLMALMPLRTLPEVFSCDE